MATSSLNIGVEAACITSLFIVNCIILPLDIHWFCRFWKYRHSLIIKCRKPNLLLIQLSSLWLSIFIFQAVAIPSYFGHGKHYRFIGFVQAFIALPLFLINFFMSFSRYWLLFYIINWNASIKDHEWESIINPENAKDDFYLRNRKKWGSWKWLRPRIIIIGLITYICITLEYVIQIEIGIHNFGISLWILYIFCCIIVLILTSIIPLSGYYFMYRNISKIADEIGLKRELKASIRLFSIFILMTYGIVILYFFSQHEFSNFSHEIFKIIFQACFISLRILFCICNHRHTQWIIYNYGILLIKQHTEKEAFSLIHQKTFIKLEDMSATSTQRLHGDSSVRTQMRHILYERKMFDGFMRRLLDEYCAECLLSVVEFTQFKDRILKEKLQKNQNKKNSLSIIKQQKEEIDCDQFLILPQDCPKSYIVYYDESSRDNFKLIARKLWLKYIRIGSTLEINIDYTQRNIYRSLFQNEENWRRNIVHDDPRKL